jgi:hypothetical protein
MSVPSLYGWESVKAIREAFIEDYNGRVDEKVAAQFDADMKGLIVAVLDSSGYEESAHILFRRGRKLFEVEASHCSCNGFEGQWNPEPVEWKQLAMRPKGWISYDTKEACEYVEALVARRAR